MLDSALAAEQPIAKALDPTDPAGWEMLAEQISAELAASAPARDSAGGAPVAEIDSLRQSGLLSALERARIGEGGVSWPQALRLVRIVSRGDSSLAHLLGYHYAIGQAVWLSATPDQALALSSAAVREGWYWAAVDNPLDPEIVLTRGRGGFLASGRKSFATGAQLADRVLLSGAFDGIPVLATIPADREGFSPNDDWDNVGQRATVSGSVELHEVVIGAQELLGPFPPRAGEPSPYATLVAPITQIVLANVLLGAAEGAFADALAYTRAITRPWQSSGIASAVQDPYILERYGELAADLQASLALAEQAALSLEQALAQGPALSAQARAKTAVAVYAAKVHSTRVSLAVTSTVFELMGARATARRYAFDRRWRDVRTLTLHDPVAYKAREVGEHVLTGTAPRISLYS